MKTCLKCGAIKPFSEYHAKRGKPQPQCKTCRSEYMRGHYLKNKDRVNMANKAWYEANKSSVCEKLKRQYKENPEKFVFARKLQKYALTKDRFQAMLVQQNNACEICRMTFVGTPYVDHCHTTQEVRGLLCSKCNTGYGLLNEDVAVFESCIAYTKKYKK